MSIFLLFVELLQIYILGRKYHCLQNYAELCGNLFALIHSTQIVTDLKWLGVVMATLIYSKMLTSLLIFKQFRKLISLIMRCIEDMITFLTLVPLMIFTFTVLNFVIEKEYEMNHTHSHDHEHLSPAY